MRNRGRVSDQDIFDRVYTQLLAQGKRSYGPLPWPGGGEYTLLRGPEGTKDAIGCLIPDELYRWEMEDKPVEWLLEKFPELKEFLGTNIKLIKQLQVAHNIQDYIFDKDRFHRSMKKIAEMHDLEEALLEV